MTTHPILTRPRSTSFSPQLTVLALALASSPVWGEENNDTTEKRQRATATTLPAIEVSSAPDILKKKAEVSIDSVALPAAVTVITNEEIGTLNVGRDISNIFRRVPGVVANNIDQGDTGNGFRMRGFATQGTHGADTAVYVDGVPQNMPSSQGGAGHGPVFLEWLTPDMIGQVDVIKGPVSALYGDQNRAGSVNITTRHGGAATPSSIGVTAESYGGRRLSMVLSGEYEDIQSLFVADLYRSDSYRRNVDNSRDNLFWKLSKKIGDGLYSLRASYYEADFTAAGYLSVPALQAGLDPRSVQNNNPGFGNAKRSSLVFNRTPLNGEAGWYASAYAEQFERTRGITASATSHNVGSDDRTILGGRLARNFVINERSAVFVGAEVRQDRGDAMRRVYQNRIPTANYINNQDLDLLTYGVFAQGQYLALPNLKLTLGARYDKFDYSIVNRKLPAASTDYSGSVFTPKYGVLWSITPTLDLFANVAQGFRSPAAEQISSSGSTGPLGATGSIINSSIAPTKVKSYDLGLNASPLKDLFVSGALYYTINEDEIVQTSPDVYRTVGDTTRKGFELETRYKLNSAASVYASYGRIITAKINNPVAGTAPYLSVPRHQYKAGAEYKMQVGAGRLTLNADAYLTAGNPYASGTPSVRKDMPTYTRYDLKATYDYQKIQTSVFAIFQPHKYGTDIAYGSTGGLLISPQPHTLLGASVRYFF
ncbi:Colicin I receptor precursor [compost metagenome]